MPDRPVKSPMGVRSRAARLLSEIGCESNVELFPLGAGGNNRVYRVETNSHTYVLKEYFRHPGDIRDRLGAEFAFVQFAWARGIRCIPEAIVSDTSAGLGLFSFIEGDRIAPGSFSGAEIQEALEFVMSLNRCRHIQEARQLPDGSEACFSIDQHFDLIQRRLFRLSGIVPASPVDHEALVFVRETLSAAFEALKERILVDLTEKRIAHDVELLKGERVISPSDFGFHNALRRPDGTLTFLDFEYAGWDDPAKLTGDFFSQVEVPVPIIYQDEVLTAISGILPERELALRRMNLLLPIYRIKWCCILLNHFLPVDSERRAFAQGDAEGRKKEQINKAQKLFASLEQSMAGTLRN